MKDKIKDWLIMWSVLSLMLLGLFAVCILGSIISIAPFWIAIPGVFLLMAIIGAFFEH